MSVSRPLYKIEGNKKVKSIIRRIEQLQLSIINLEQVQKVLSTVINNYQPFTEQQILPSFTIDAIITYAKCFVDGNGFKISHTLFNNGLRPEAASNEISERDFHNLIMNYRHKHLAHSDTLLTVIGVGGCKFDDGRIAVGPVVGLRVPIEDIIFYKNFTLLVIKAKQHLLPQLQHGLNELTALIQQGEAKITNEILEFKPISDDAKKTWGLK
jgi:hypothetical protein